METVSFSCGETANHTTVERSHIIIDRRMANLEGAILDQFELPLNSPHVILMRKGLDQYNKACMEAKNLRIKVGPACLYLTDAPCESVVIHSHIEGKEDFKKAVLTIVMENVQLKFDKLFAICRVCTLKTAKHVNYLQIRIEPEHKLIKNYIYRTLLGEGKRTVLPLQHSRT